MRAAPALLLVAATVPLAGCGAGIVTAGLAGSRGRNEPPPPPTITLSQPLGPLVIGPDEFYVRRAVLRNARVSLEADLELRLAATVDGVVVEDVQTLLFVEGSSNEVTLTFAMRTEAIVDSVGDPRDADVAAELVVLAGTAPAITQLFRTPFLLQRQPTAQLVANDPAQGISVVSVLGGELTMSVIGLPTRDPRDLVVEVVTEDPNPPAGQPGSAPAVLQRRASNLRTEPDPLDPQRTIVRCTMPSSTFPTPAFVRVTHATAGRSTVVADVYYRPELTGVVSRRGSTDGGDLVSLTGPGLVPFDFSTRPARLDFSSIRLFVEKGGVVVEVGAADLRPSSSSLNNVVFLTPPSPDGRPGPVTLRLRTLLPLAVDVEAKGLFAYGAREPDFGPRGVRIGADAVAADFGTRAADAPPGTPLDAAVVEADAAGVPVVRVLESRGNGTFSRLGLPIQAADRADLDQRFPIDLVWGRYDDDPHRDLVVVNRGTLGSTHTVLRGLDDPSAPLRFGGVAFRSISWPSRAHAGRFDDDARDDVLVVGPDDGTTRYATPGASGAFVVRPVFGGAVARLDASHVTDVDGDGESDLLFARGGAGAELRVAFGAIGPLFPDHRVVDLSTLTVMTNGTVVGVGATGPPPSRVLVIVVRDASGGAPSIVLLPPAAPRSYGAGALVVPMAAAGGEPRRTLSADLDGDLVDELLVARDAGGISLWAWDGATLVERTDGVQLAPADTGQVIDLAAGTAVPDGGNGRLGVFVTHVAPLGAGVAPRITTLLVEEPGPVLVDPFASRTLPAAPTDLAIGEFGGGGGDDVVVASADRLDILGNDGVGELTPIGQATVVGLVPRTLVEVALAPGDLPQAVAFLLEDGRVAWRPAGGTLALSQQALFDQSGTATAESRLAVGDVDGDDRNDLVVLLAVERPAPVRIERSLQLLRGRDPAVDPFPFVVPIAAARTMVPARATSLALGDLAPDAVGERLEVALAVGRDDPERGLHFHRLEPGTGEADWSLVRSIIDPADPRVAAGLDPALVLAGDLEADGLADLVVVSGSLDVVQVFRQTGPSTRPESEGEVDPLVFAPTAEWVLPPGEPVAAHLADVDGDGIPDVIAQVKLRATPDAHAIPVVISNGFAGFAGGFQVPAGHVGSFGPDLGIAVRDLNRDGLSDLVLAWSGDTGAIEPRIRVLFGTHR